MDATKRKALEAAGWQVGDAADFLELDDDERQLLDARVKLALAIRRQREASKLSQSELGAKLKSTLLSAATTRNAIATGRPAFPSPQSLLPNPYSLTPNSRSPSSSRYKRPVLFRPVRVPCQTS